MHDNSGLLLNMIAHVIVHLFCTLRMFLPGLKMTKLQPEYIGGAESEYAIRVTKIRTGHEIRP